MGRGFQAHPPSIHAHAQRTSQRADQVSQSGSSASGAGLHGEALGAIGGSAASGHQTLTGRLQSAIGQAGSRLQNQSDLLHRTGNSISDTDTDHAGRIRGINEPTSNVRNPHAQSTRAPSRPSAGPSRPAPPPHLPSNGGSTIPPEAQTMAQWIRDHRQNGSIISHAPRPDGGTDIGEKLNPVVWNGTAHNPNQQHNPNGSTYGGRVYGNQTDNEENRLPQIGKGDWDHGGYFKLQPGASTTDWRQGQYYEFDVKPTPNWRGGGAPDRSPEGGAGGGRVVVGDDGSMYYSDHYENPQQIQGPVLRPPGSH